MSSFRWKSGALACYADFQNEGFHWLHWLVWIEAKSKTLTLRKQETGGHRPPFLFLQIVSKPETTCRDMKPLDKRANY